MVIGFREEMLTAFIGPVLIHPPNKRVSVLNTHIHVHVLIFFGLQENVKTTLEKERKAMDKDAGLREEMLTDSLEGVQSSLRRLEQTSQVSSPISQVSSFI